MATRMPQQAILPAKSCTKPSADQLGDLLYDLYSAGYGRDFERYLSCFLEIVVSQLHHNITPSADPFHLLFYMGQSPVATRLCLRRFVLPRVRKLWLCQSAVQCRLQQVGNYLLQANVRLSSGSESTDTT
jgi:hypothetical protein